MRLIGPPTKSPMALCSFVPRDVLLFVTRPTSARPNGSTRDRVAHDSGPSSNNHTGWLEQSLKRSRTKKLPRLPGPTAALLHKSMSSRYRAPLGKLLESGQTINRSHLQVSFDQDD